MMTNNFYNNNKSCYWFDVIPETRTNGAVTSRGLIIDDRRKVGASKMMNPLRKRSNTPSKRFANESRASRASLVITSSSVRQRSPGLLTFER